MINSDGTLPRIGQIILAAMIILAAAFPSGVLKGFEQYDHVLNNIAFSLMSQFRWLPQSLTHDVIMALGFLVLGLLSVFLPAVLGVKRSWVVVGLLFLALNVFWWYVVELEVAKATGNAFRHAFDAAVLSTYIANSIGAFAGAYAGEALALFIRPAAITHD